MRWLLVWLISAAPLVAQPLDTQDSFDAYTQGRTLYFQLNNGREVEAAETYLPGNRVRWFTRDGTCITGEWYAQNQLICFIYENNPDPQCWATSVGPNGLEAVSQGPLPTRVSEVDPGEASFQCLGPKIGV